MKNIVGAWINTGSSEFFVNESGFFTNLKLSDLFNSDSIKTIDFVDSEDEILQEIKRVDCKDADEFRCHFDNIVVDVLTKG